MVGEAEGGGSGVARREGNGREGKGGVGGGGGREVAKEVGEGGGRAATEVEDEDPELGVEVWEADEANGGGVKGGEGVCEGGGDAGRRADGAAGQDEVGGRGT